VTPKIKVFKKNEEEEEALLKLAAAGSCDQRLPFTTHTKKMG